MELDELFFAFLGYVGFIITIIVAYLFPVPFFQSLLTAISTTFLGVGIALTFVNFYLDRKSRRKAVKSLLRFVVPSINKLHNSLLDDVWNLFGKPQFGDIIDRYVKNNSDPMALTPDERNKIYSAIKNRRSYYEDLLAHLETDMRELAPVLGWSYDPEILGASFACRYAIAKLRGNSFDDTDKSKLEACENFLDADWYSFAVYTGLKGLT